MNRINVALFALAFVQLVKCQTPCLDAQAALSSSVACVTAISVGTDRNTLCMGTCLDLMNAIINDCDAMAASTYIMVIDNLCSSGNTNITVDACLTATTAFETTIACATALSDANTLCMGMCRDLVNDILRDCDATAAANFSTVIGLLCNGTATNGTGPGACGSAFSSISSNCSTYITAGDSSVCTGTCASQVQDAVIVCGATLDPEIMELLNAYTIVCSSIENACLAAKSALNANTVCMNGMTNNDSSVLCFGDCRTLIEAYISACGRDSSAFNQVCGFDDCPSAISNISPRCISYLEDADTDVCDATGSCRGQLEGAASVCTDLDSNAEAAEILNQYNGVCNEACMSASSTLDNDAECNTTVSDGSTAACRGRCKTLFTARFGFCPVSNDERSLYNKLCGSASMVMKSGITLLFTAICVLAF